MTYYNEFDPDMAEWLRELIGRGEIPDGYVDTRSITEVRPHDLYGYTQHHFFAGLGGWALALRLAGWPEDRPVRTASCPCQPFSVAGKGKGTQDERHLWPVFFELARQLPRAPMFGEQVCSLEVIAGKQGKGRGISEDVSFQEPSEGPSAACSTKGSKKGSGIRFEREDIRYSESYRRWLLRGFRDPVKSSWWEDVGQPLNRPDKPSGGLYLFQHQNSLPCSEQCAGGLGRGQDDGDCQVDHGEANSSLQRSLGKARSEFDDAIGGAWLAGVRADLEAAGYAVGACDIPAAGVGAPHLRQRLYWVADRQGLGRRQECADGIRSHGGSGKEGRPTGPGLCGTTSRLADSISTGLEGHSRHGDARNEPGRIGAGEAGPVTESGAVGGVGYTAGNDEQRNRVAREGGGRIGETGGSSSRNSRLVHPDSDRRQQGSAPSAATGHRHSPDAAGFWADSRWLLCRDGKHRRIPTLPALFPLASGLPYKLARRGSVRPAILKGAGNAIVPQVAAVFIQAFLAA